MKFKLLDVALSVMAVLFSVSDAGAATAVEYALNVKDFTQLVVDDGFNVEYKSSSDSAGMAVFHAPKNIADKIIFENNNKGNL